MRVSSNAGMDPRVVGLPFGVGDVIAGKYRVDKVLGAGGMGLVLAGHHVALDQRVAIKVLKPQALDNPEYVARFAREARAAAKLRGEHIARVLDVGQLETGLPYMVLEYLHGKDLSQIVKERGTLSVTETADYVIQACEAIAEAHRAGIVHRDIKPANLFVTKRHDGSTIVKVLDFGISKMSKVGDDSGPSENLTQTQTMIGSPHYMSPEQLKSARTVDARTDVWSLGGVLYKLLTGEPAFNGDSAAELCVAILMQEPRPMRELKPDIPHAIERVVLRCLAKDPKDRFQSVGELASALAPFAPPDSRQSVDRIGRVAATADPLTQGSDPPPAPMHDQGIDVIMTTLTASAATMPTKPTDGSKLTESSLDVPLESSRGRWWMLGGALAIVVVGGVAFGAKTLASRSTAPSPPSVAQAAAPTPSPSPSPSPLPSAAPTPAVEPATAAAPAISASAVPVKPTFTARPIPTTTATAAPPPTTTATATATTPLSDFGGRK
jgi:serine/threonine protein kinase